MAPADENECRQMLYTASTLNCARGRALSTRHGPGRTGRGADDGRCPWAAPQMRREGRSGLALLVFGTLLEPAQKIAERLDATLVNMRFVKPLDENLVLSVAARHRAIVTIEENAIAGGAGSAVGELLAARGRAAAAASDRHPRPVHRARLAR